jgi:hypothetical protein
MCAKLHFDLLNNIVKPIERNQTTAKLKVNLKKLLTKCARHKLIHKNPRLKVVKRIPKANSVADGTDERPSAKRTAEIKLAVANGHKMPIAKPPPGVLQGYVIPGSTIPKKSAKKSVSKATSKKSAKATRPVADTESDEEKV